MSLPRGKIYVLSACILLRGGRAIPWLSALCDLAWGLGRMTATGEIAHHAVMHFPRQPYLLAFQLLHDLLLLSQLAALTLTSEVTDGLLRAALQLCPCCALTCGFCMCGQ